MTRWSVLIYSETETINARAEMRSGSPQSDASTAPLLVLGGQINQRFDATFETDPTRPCAAILLLGEVTRAQLADTLNLVPDPAVPVADFAANKRLRHDFVAALLDRASLGAMRYRFTPIWRRLAEFPFRFRTGERTALALLRHAYARECPITARFAISQSALVEYDFLAGEPCIRRHLESLADQRLLARRHFTRTHSCGVCASARLNAFEACPKCDSGDLQDEKLVHHYRCGWQDAESQFIQGNQLICPKCRRELRHFGVDFDKPGNIVRCRTCGNVTSDPTPRFTCLDCGAVTNSDQAATTDWYHYELTEHAVLALRAGRLDDAYSAFDDASADGCTCSFAEFLLLSEEAVRMARRFHRPFNIGALTITNRAELQATLGADRFTATLRGIVDGVADMLEDGEFVALGRDNSILVGLPETTRQQAIEVITHLREAASTLAPARLACDVWDGEAAAAMLRGH